MRRLLILCSLVAATIVVAPPASVQTAPKRARLSLDLDHHVRARARHGARVIVHGSRERIRELAARHRLRIVRDLAEGSVIEATGAQLEALAAEPDLDHLSGDVPVHSAMTVSNRSTAADQTRSGTSGLLGLIGSISGVTGKGIGIALLDSGISAHKALGTRVVANVSFVTGDPDKADEFGHGTHIAGIISGTSTGTTAAYSGGIAPGAHLVNVRVLGANGTGLTSDVIAGIDWVIANRSLYNIRIINLSLGHSVMEPASSDPLCEAVERAARAGIVVIASAGNRGKTADGRTILGGITSPGNSPYAITVGALNTMTTVSRSDDRVATYSSRGPTRFDLAVKPDVVAPGNKVVSLEAAGSYLARTYPSAHVAGSGTNAYMRLSGSSMATGVVSGGVALLLQGSKSLTPRHVKLLLQTGAGYLRNDGLVAGGAGSVNLWSSRRAAVNGLDDLLTALPLIGGLITSPGGAAYWDEGTMTSRMYSGNGVRLLGLGDLLGALLNPSSLEWGTLHLVGANNPIGSMEPNYVVWGDIAAWAGGDYVVWGDRIPTPEGNYVVWGDTQYTEGYYVVWGDSLIEGDPQ